MSTSGLVETLLEIGRRRQIILENLRDAYLKNDLDIVLRCVVEILSLNEAVKKEPDEKSH